MPHAETAALDTMDDSEDVEDVEDDTQDSPEPAARPRRLILGVCAAVVLLLLRVMSPGYTHLNRSDAIPPAPGPPPAVDTRVGRVTFVMDDIERSMGSGSIVNHESFSFILTARHLFGLDDRLPGFSKDLSSVSTITLSTPGGGSFRSTSPVVLPRIQARGTGPLGYDDDGALFVLDGPVLGYKLCARPAVRGMEVALVIVQNGHARRVPGRVDEVAEGYFTLEAGSFSVPGTSGSPVLGSSDEVLGTLTGWRGVSGGRRILCMPSAVLIEALRAVMR